MTPVTPPRVLQLATSDRAFFRLQVEALEDRGVECAVVTVPNEGESRGAREYLSFSLRTLGYGLDDFDLVHANYGLTAPFAFAQPTRPVVLTLWGSDLMGSGWLPRLSVAAARRADAVIAPWEPLSRELDGRCDHDVIPFGVDTGRFRPIDRSAARERVGWPDDRSIVLFPYDPDRPVKNYPLAERTVSRLSTDAELRVVDGAPYEEMPYYMNASDAVLVTSERESGPMVVREAAACNVPVVSTDVGAAADVLDDVRNSRVVADEPSLVADLDAVLADGRRSDGRATVDDLGVHRMAERLLSVYDEVR